jgi:hypothetical protein
LATVSKNSPYPSRPPGLATSPDVWLRSVAEFFGYATCGAEVAGFGEAFEVAQAFGPECVDVGDDVSPGRSVDAAIPGAMALVTQRIEMGSG